LSHRKESLSTSLTMPLFDEDPFQRTADHGGDIDL